MTDHEPTRPVYTADLTSPANATTPHQPRGWRRAWVVGTFTVLLGLSIGACVETSEDGTEAVSSATSPTATATATVTETAPAPSPPTVTETAPKPETKPDANSGNRSAGRTFELPDATGQNLQIAQDNIQEASGDPLFVSFSEDATGASRMQILDSGWVVSSQKPAAGAIVRMSAVVTYFVVRAGEGCP